MASTLQHILVSPCPPHTRAPPSHKCCVCVCYICKKVSRPFQFPHSLRSFHSPLPLSSPFSPPRCVYKPKCLTLALSSAHPSVIYTNPSLASRSHFLLSPHFVVVLLVASFVCFSCCYKKLIRIVNFVFIKQAGRQQTAAESLKHSDSRFKIKIFITTRRHLFVPFRSVQNSACLACLHKNVARLFVGPFISQGRAGKCFVPCLVVACHKSKREVGSQKKKQKKGIKKKGNDT